MPENVTELTLENFNEFIKEDKVVVDFWAEWCGPCKMISPIIEDLAKDLNGKAKFGKVNVDNNQELAQRFGVMSIPTLVFFRDGQQVDSSVGVISKEDIEKKIKEIK